MSTQLENQSGTDVTPSGAWPSARHVASRRIARALAEVPHRQGAEDYDAILWRLCARRSEAADVGLLLGLTSCNRQAGVSTLAANLAIRAADHGLGPVLLVDANVHAPELHKLIRGERKGGLADLLAGREMLDACVQATPVHGLDVLPLGSPGGCGGARVDPQQIDALVSQLREQYAIAICDLPAAREIGPALLLARTLDAVLLVVRAEHVDKRVAQQAVRELPADGVNLIGAVVTDRRNYVPHWLNKLL